MEMKRKHESPPTIDGADLVVEDPHKHGLLQPLSASKIKTRKRTSDIENSSGNELDAQNASPTDPISDDEQAQGNTIGVNQRISLQLEESNIPSSFGLEQRSPNSIQPANKIFARESQGLAQDSTNPINSVVFPPKRARNRNPGNLILDLSQMATIPSPKPTKSDYSNVCSQVTDFMFVGGSVVAAQRELLQSHGITHVINCAATITPNYFPEEFNYYHLRLRDHATQDIHQHFYNIFHFIDSARERHGKVFIHCVKGISRSPTMAIAYLMAREQLGLYPALDLVRSSRPVIDPNAGFIFQLNEWDTLRQQSRKHVTVFKIAMAPEDSDFNTSEYPLIIGPVSPEKLVGTSSPTQEYRQIHDEHASSCFVVCSMESKYCSLWCGRDASENLVETGKHAMRLLQTYEAFPETFDVVWSGQEPSAFWNVLAPEQDPNAM